MADRWAVVEALGRGLSYREVHDRTGVSVTTVGRVARYLERERAGIALHIDELEERTPYRTRGGATDSTQ